MRTLPIKTKEIEPNVCLVTSPRSKASITPLSNIVTILCGISNELHLITGNEGREILKSNSKVKGISIEHSSNKNYFLRIVFYILLQFNITYNTLKISKKTNVYIFFMAEGLLLPVIALKLFRKYVVLDLAASSPKMIDSTSDCSFVSKIPKYLELVNYKLCDNMILYSANITKEWNLNKYSNKILIAHEHYIDFNEFKVKSKLDERELIIGYVGRFSDEKGLLNFVSAIPTLLKHNPKIKITLGGTGPLEKTVRTYVKSNNLDSNVEFVGWISHANLCDHLNKLKLIVIPSFTEGLPNIMLESMATGTPVIATSVGAIPDVIQDGVTGFLIPDNFPITIANKIIEVLDHPHLESVSINAIMSVKQKYTYEAASDSFYKIISAIE